MYYQGLAVASENLAKADHLLKRPNSTDNAELA